MELKLDLARRIQGWMTDAELEWLADQATRHYRIVEVGSWKGRSTAALASNTRGVVFAIDTWKGSAEHTADQVGPEGWLLEQFARNMQGLPVLPIVGDSVAVATHFQKVGSRYFDMVFIDAAHDAASVRADIVAWAPLLQEGGLLCGHDFGTWQGLEDVVLETVGDVFVMDSIWFRESKELKEGVLEKP